LTVRTRHFRPFSGTPTSTLARILVLPRYAYREVFRAKLVTGLFTSSLLLPVGALVVVWLKHNTIALAKTPLAAGLPFPIDQTFFGFLLLTQSYFAFALTLFAGPSIVSPDLVNGGLPLYLSRPLSRWQYVTGKFLVLALLLSSITWAPMLLVFMLQASLAPESWLIPNLAIAGSILAASFLLIFLLSIVAMAISAWVRNRAVARALLFALLVIPAAVGRALSSLLGTELGRLIDLGAAWGRVLEGLFGIPSRGGLPLGGSWAALVAASFLALLLLHKKLRAFEVVR
jgi:ABC-type transport system involved in multi-copper enzyme maturation permease subunit